MHNLSGLDHHHRGILDLFPEICYNQDNFDGVDALNMDILDPFQHFVYSQANSWSEKDCFHMDIVDLVQ